MNIFTFNFYYDIYFWIAFSIIVIVFRILSFNKISRNIFLLISSILMLLALPQFNLGMLLLLIIVSIIVLFFGFLLNKKDLFKTKIQRIIISITSILFILLVLIFFKYSWIQEFTFKHILNKPFDAGNLLFLIGISYSSFKMMHFIIESYKHKIKDLNFINFFNYIFYFPAFISGPINRYNHFIEEINYRQNTNIKQDLKIGLERIIHGLFKKFVLAAIVFPYVLINIKSPIAEVSIFKIIIGIYAYTLYIYFDFAGYSDIAIGSARIIGIELPENFNNPFIKRNIQQLWANWHISLTGWLTDYVYWPLARKLRNYNYFKKNPITLSNICIIITFIAVGIWHGEEFNFIVWGLYHGIGLAILNSYQKLKRKVRNPYIKKYYKSKLSQLIGIFVTFNFFTFGILFFTWDMTKISEFFLKII